MCPRNSRPYVFIGMLLACSAPSVFAASPAADDAACESQIVTVRFEGLALGMDIQSVTHLLTLKNKKFKDEVTTHLYTRSRESKAVPLDHAYHSVSYTDTLFHTPTWVYLNFGKSDQLIQISIRFKFQEAIVNEWVEQLKKDYGLPCSKHRYNDSCLLWGQQVDTERPGRQSQGDYIMLCGGASPAVTFSNRRYAR